MDYKKAYYHLFNSVSDSIEQLMKIQAEAEEFFIKENDKEEFKKGISILMQEKTSEQGALAYDVASGGAVFEKARKR